MKHRHLTCALFCAASLFFFPKTALFAQNIDDCGTTEFLQHLKKTGQAPPVFYQKKGGAPVAKPLSAAAAVPKRCGKEPVIPVVVHIFHLGEAVGTGSNLSVAAVNAGIQNLNDRWANITGMGVPMGIRFELARRDPMGNATTGIVRIDASAVPGYAANGTSFNGSPGPQDVVLKDLSKWPITDYYNIWVVHSINGFPAGYAFYPGNGTGNQYDGTIVRDEYFSGGKTIPHELGHAFSLPHTFEGDDAGCPVDNDCTTDGDGVCDTPPHKEADCGATNPCTATGIWDNSRFNYMSYCGASDRFTAGQRVKVQDALYQSVRAYLLESKGLIPVNEPKELAIEEIVFPKLISCTPSFKPVLRIKNNGTADVTSFDYDLFVDGILDGNYVQNTTTIPAGQTVDVELTAITTGPGAHDFEVALTGINAGSLDLFHYDNAICGFFAQKDLPTADLCHDHEGNSLATAMTYADTASFAAVQLPAPLFCPTVQGHAMLIDASASDEEESEFVLGPIDLAGLTAPILSFDVARQQPFSNCNEYATLTITASPDCGKTSTVLYEKNDAPPFPCFGNQYPNTPERLNTAYGAINGVFYVPQGCSEWRRESIDLGAFAGQTVTIRFSAKWFRARAQSNILYFDNFCLNKCLAPTAPFLLNPMPDTVRVCLFGDTTLTLSTNQATENNVAYLWHEATSLAGPWSLLSTTKDGTAYGFALGTKFLRGISNKNGCSDTLFITFITTPPVTLTLDPVNTTACFGDEITLTGASSAPGDGLTPIYFWESGPTGAGPWTPIPNSDTDSFSFQPPLGNGYYHLVAGAAEAGCFTDFSFPALVRTDPPVEITVEPTPITECQGGNDKVMVTVTGGGTPKYQWQRATDPAGPWANFGPNQPMATPNSATPGTYYVRVIASSTNGYCQDTSIVVTQTVVADPVFSQQPVSQSGCVGQPITFTAAATGGTGTFTYQWTTAPDFASPFTPIPGATGPSYSPVNGAGINYYQLVVTQSGTGCNILNSNAVSLALDDPATVTLDPPDIAECTGGQLPMDAAVTGTGFIQIQWQSAPAPGGPWTNYSHFSADFTPPSIVIGVKYYRLIVRSEFGYCKDTSAVAAAQIVAAPSITAQPEDFNGCAGATIPLTVGATGGFPPLNYEWQSSTNPGGPFLPITNSNSAIYNAPDQPGPIYYQVVVSTAAAGCPTVISQPASVTSGGQLAITADPQDLTECIGGTKTLSATVASATPVDYFWMSSNSPAGPFTFAAAPNSATFTPPSIALGTTYFQVIVQTQNGACADTSAVAAVEIVENATITDQPDDKADCSGNPTTLTVAATGGIAPLSYQWQNGASALGPWTDIAGATGASHFIPNAQGGSFYQVVINSAPGSGCPAVVSDAATVSFDAPFLITQQPGPIAECVGGLDGFNVTTSGTGGLDYQWEVSNSPTGPFANVNGANGPDFTPSSATAGTSFYRLIIISPDGLCRDTTDVAEVLVAPQMTFTLQPIGYSGCEGADQTLSVTATGGIGPLNYQWQQTTAGNIPFADILGEKGATFLSPGTIGYHYYRVVVNSPGAGCNAAISGVATVTIDPFVSSMMTSPTDLTECVGGGQQMTAISTGGQATYQWQAGPSANGPFADVPGATTLNFTPPSTVAGQVFYKLILRSINGFCMDTSAVQSMTVAPDLAIAPQPVDYEACVGGSLTLVSGATGGLSPTYQWQVAPSAAGPWTNVPGATTTSFDPPLATGGTFFYQMIASSAGAGCQAATSTPAEILLHPSVAISAQPQSITECFGGNQQLMATASGGSSLTYQWQVQLPNGTWQNIPGATGAGFTPPSAVNFSTMNYRVIVSDALVSCGTQTSAVAAVTVQTSFSVKNNLDACNFPASSQPSTIDFNAQVTTGDPTPVWQSIDAAAPPGPWTAKDFTGWAPGTYRFVATMDDNIAPCKAVSDTLFVQILDCCPTVCTDAPAFSLCSAAAQPFDLSTLECAGIAPGSWSLTAGPGVTAPVPLANGLFDPAGKLEGAYTVVYQLSGNVPAVCASTSSETLNIVESPDAGTAVASPVFCESQPQVVQLAGLLTGEDPGGVWKDISQPAAPGGLFNATSATLNLTGLLPGDYSFEYKISGVAGCPGDDATVSLTLGKTPVAMAGGDALLTCDNPKTDLGSPQNGADGATILWEETSHNGFIADPAAPIWTTAEPGFYQITATDPATGCTATDAAEVLASQNFITDVEVLTEGPSCNGLADGQIEVASITGGSAPITISLNDGAAGAETKFTKLAPGVFTLTVIDKDGCSTERTVALVDPPPLTVELPDEARIFCGDSLLLDPIVEGGTGALAWLWFADLTQLVDTSGLSFLAKPERKTVFSIKITDENGCRAEASTKIYVEENLPVFAPTAFMPGSAANPVFRLFAHEKVQRVVSFRIYDRSGALLFEQKNKALDDADFGWDGSFRGRQLRPGVFVYTAEVDLCDRRVVLKGSVTLVR